MLSTSCIDWLHVETGWETNNCITLTDKGQNFPRTGKHKDTDKRNPRNIIHLDLKKNNQPNTTNPSPQKNSQESSISKDIKEMKL